MTFLYSLLSGMFGAFASILPVSLGGHAVFLNKVNASLTGMAGFSFGNDVIFTVYLAVFIGLFVICREKIMTSVSEIKEKTYIQSGSDTKGMLICLAFYIPSALYIAFFENARFPIWLLAMLILINTVINFICDYIEKPKISEKNRNLIMGLSLMLGALSGLSEISSVFLAGLLSGKKPSKAINFAIITYVPVVLIKTLIYFIKSCISGFSLNFGYYILIFFTAFIFSVIATGFLRKTAIKRNFRFYAYYTAVFAVIAINTFMKG